MTADREGEVALATELIARAVADLRANHPAVPGWREEGSGDRVVLIHAATGHSWTCRCAECARSWFSGVASGPLSFRVCCGIVGVEPEVITRRLNMEKAGTA